MGRDFVPKISTALHTGWAVEGGIGSELKLDATYLSPQIDVTSKLAYLSEEDYKVPLILSEQLYNLLTAKVKSFLRKIDVVTTSELKDPVGLFTFDMGNETCEVPEGHKTGEVILLEDFAGANIDAYKSKSADYMFTTDADIDTLHKNADEIANQYKEALAFYVSGDWDNAFEWLDQCLGVWPSDGPSLSLQEFIAAYNYTAPEEWRGYRNIDEPIPALGAQPEEGKEPVAGDTEETPAADAPVSADKKEPKALGAIEEHEEDDMPSVHPQGAILAPAPAESVAPGLPANVSTRNVNLTLTGSAVLTPANGSSGVNSARLDESGTQN